MSAVLEVLTESSAELAGGQPDPLMIFAKTSPTPRNSGAQNVFPKIVKLRDRALRMRPPFQQLAKQIAKQALYGYAAIGSENAMYLRELNTQRMSQTNFTPNTGQAADEMDDYIYGKGYLKNNPRKKSSGGLLD